jgi:DNA-directed RNA polymerase subunit D
MEIIENTNEKVRFTGKMNISLANAIRRSVSEVNVVAIDECDIYKNDSALYDEIISHRLGLVPLKNQKLKEGKAVELKLKAKGKDGGVYVLSGELGDLSVYPDMPIVYLEKDQEIEIVARATVGKGKDHAKYMPGIMFYRHYPKIKISKEGEAQAELAEIIPEAFEFDTKLKIKDASKCQLDEDEMKDYPGIDISFDDTLVFEIESWGQMPAKDIFIESCNALKDNLSELSKKLK